MILNVRENLKLLVHIITKIPKCTYSLFKGYNLVVRQSIRLGDDWDEVDLGVQSAHDFDVQRLESVAGGLDKVNACMYTVIHNVHPVYFVLCIQIGVEACFNVLNNGPPRIVVVDEIAKTWCVDNGES